MRLGKSATPVAEARIFGSDSKILDNDGNINASNNTELALAITEIAKQIRQGNFVPDSHEETQSSLETAAERRAALKEAYYDRAGNSWAELGAAITMEINERMEREGFMRTILKDSPIEDGSVARIRVKQRNVHAIATKGLAQVYPQYVRENFIPADEFYVTAQPRVEEKDFMQSSSDLLDDKYFEGLEAIMVEEDRILVKMLRAADGVSNNLTNFSGAFTPAIFAAIKRNVEHWRIPVNAAIVAMDLLTDASTGTTFSTWWDPISKWEIIKTGRIGNVLGTTIITDGFRQPELQVLNDGEFFILGAPEYLGGYTSRYPVQSRAVDEFERFVPARGWAMHEMISMVVANARSVARGQRT